MTTCRRRTGDTMKDKFYHPTLLQPSYQKGHTAHYAIAAYMLLSARRTNTTKCTSWTEMNKPQAPVRAGV
jgi:hypothetical protein